MLTVADRSPMVEAGMLSVGFSVLSGFIAVGLLAFAVRAYNRTRDPNFVFVMGAFTVFGLKSFFVAWAVSSHSVGHEVLELFDAIGDLATVALLLGPLLFPGSKE